MQSEMERPGEFSEGEGRQRVCDEDGLPEQGEQDRLTGACSIRWGGGTWFDKGSGSRKCIKWLFFFTIFFLLVGG